jgi:hypothetical protein
MRGPEGVSEDLADWLAGPLTVVLDPDAPDARQGGALDVKLAELTARLDLDEDLAPPALVTTEGRPVSTLAFSEFPALFVVAQAAERFRRQDVVDGAIIYLVRYPVRIFVFARGDTFDDTDRARKRLTLAVREVILNNQERLGVDEDTYRESYSDVTGLDDRNVRTVAGAFIEVTIEVEESLGAEALYDGTPAEAPDPAGWELDLTDLSLLPHPEADDA